MDITNRHLVLIGEQLWIDFRLFFSQDVLESIMILHLLTFHYLADSNYKEVNTNWYSNKTTIQEITTQLGQ